MSGQNVGFTATRSPIADGGQISCGLCDSNYCTDFPVRLHYFVRSTRNRLTAITMSTDRAVD